MSYYLYRLATLVVPLLPERFGYWLFARLGDLSFRFNAARRARYIRNQRHILGSDAKPAEVARITRRAFQNQLKNYYDLFRGHVMTRAAINAQLTQIVGFEHLERALAQKKGLIGGTAHFGNFNLFVHLAAVYLQDENRAGADCKIVVPMERLEPARLFEFVTQLRASQGITIIPVDTAGRALIKALRAGHVVGIALDYDVMGSGPLVEFFGAPARLPDGAVALALKYGAPLILAFTRRLDDNKCQVVVEPPLEFVATGDLAADTRAGIQQVARVLEKWIRAYPDQWLIFQPIWESDKSGSRVVG